MLPFIWISQTGKTKSGDRSQNEDDLFGVEGGIGMDWEREQEKLLVS